MENSVKSYSDDDRVVVRLDAANGQFAVVKMTPTKALILVTEILQAIKAAGEA